MAHPKPKDAGRVENDDKRRPPPRDRKPDEQPEPLDEESLDKVMRETPL